MAKIFKFNKATAVETRQQQQVYQTVGLRKKTVAKRWTYTQNTQRK